MEILIKNTSDMDVQKGQGMNSTLSEGSKQSIPLIEKGYMYGYIKIMFNDFGPPG